MEPIRIIATGFLARNPEIKQKCVCLDDFSAEELLAGFLRNTLDDYEDVVTKVERFRGVEMTENPDGSIDVVYSFSPKPKLTDGNTSQPSYVPNPPL